MATQKSESIAKLADALSKAQGSFKLASKDKTNPHFRFQYADLAAVREACKDALAANGLCYMQPVNVDNGTDVIVDTIVMHNSGEWIASSLTMKAKDAGPQSIGSAITYGKRYLLAAMLGVVGADEDDDGEQAEGRSKTQQKPAQKTESRAQWEPGQLEQFQIACEEHLQGDLEKAKSAISAIIKALPDGLKEQAKAKAQEMFTADRAKRGAK